MEKPNVVNQEAGRGRAPALFVQRLLVNVAVALAWSLPGYRTSSRSCATIASFAPKADSSVKLRPSGDRFHFPANDPYWLRLLSPAYNYEPDVRQAAAAAAGIGFDTFVDGGANFGYWTVALRGLFDHIRSVEAATGSYTRLERNAAGWPSVSLYRRAIWDTDGHEVGIVSEGLDHSGVFARERPDNDFPADTELVQTISLDTLLQDYTEDQLARTLIKLDIEGAEERALLGASRAIDAGAAFVLEDHGNDLACSSYAAAIRLIPQPLVLLLRQEGGVAIPNKRTLQSLKSQTGVGYNLLVCSGTSQYGAALVNRLRDTSRTTIQERVWKLTLPLLKRLESDSS